MRKSKAIALSLLGLGTASLIAGCGGNTKDDLPPAAPPQQGGPVEPSEPTEVVFDPDDTWFDAEGNPIPKELLEGPDGVSRPVTQPHDRLGRPWVKDENGELVPQPSTTVHSRPALGGIMFLYIPGVGGRCGSIAPPLSGGMAALRPGMPGVAKAGFGSIGSGTTPGS